MRALLLFLVLATVLHASRPDAVVASDGSGDYTSLQEAISAAPMRTDPALPRWEIFVRNGVYRERIYVQRERGHLRIVGEDAQHTVIQFDLHANVPGPDGKPIGTFRTPTVQIDGDGMIWENLTIANTAGPVGQALALRADGDRLEFRRCRFLGWQDTILLNRGRHYFEDCYIEGHVDFIFGAATAWFQNCDIHVLRNGYITAASTPVGQPHGFVFADCRITGAEGVVAYLGRPWRDFAATIFLRTKMSAVVRAEGWHNWKKPHAEATVRYAEFGSTGAGASLANRVSWARALTADEAAQFTSATVLSGGDNWSPQRHVVRAPWVPDQGDGTYRNPIIAADYSDPDVVRVGDDYWMTSSSFSHVPGLPLLHSRDLVNWNLVGHALPRLVPEEIFATPQHGKGVWAPAIRYHDGRYSIYYGDPDFGIYVLTAADPRGPWAEPVLVKAGRGLIDPCPLWDEDGRVYVIHGWAKSRAGFNNVLTLLELDSSGTKVVNDFGVVIDGNQFPNYTTLEGPKFLRRNGWYYVLAPAGGVKTGWQSVFRSRDIRGPYEARIVLAQGSTPINGPHQGALVDTPNGGWWFVHFQDRDAFGRIVHLQPVAWNDDWPVMGHDPDGDGQGEPMLTARKPALPVQPFAAPTTSDDFSGPTLGPQWQWQANPAPQWVELLGEGRGLRLHAPRSEGGNLWRAPHLLLQKFPAPSFVVTAQLAANNGTQTGLIVFGTDYAWIGVESDGVQQFVVAKVCRGAMDSAPESETGRLSVPTGAVELRVSVARDGRCRFAYRAAGEADFSVMEESFVAAPGRWVGAKVGLFAQQTARSDATADWAWFQVEKFEP